MTAEVIFQYIIQIIQVLGIPGAIMAYVNYKFKRIGTPNVDEEIEMLAKQVPLRDCIYRAYKEAKATGTIDAYQLDIVKDAFKCFTAYGGKDSYLETIYRRMLDMKVKEIDDDIY